MKYSDQLENNNHYLIKFLILSIFIFTGCAMNQVRITYYSDPPGATLYEGQIAHGYTPITLIYNIPPEAINNRFLNINGVKVIWPSGVSASIDSLIVDRDKDSNFYFNFIRPDVPGREIDVNFALELERQRLLRAQQVLGLWQTYNTFLNRYRQFYVPTLPIFNSFNCTSTVIGNNVYTNCH